MRRFLYLVYGVACYAMFFGVFLYSIGFVGNFGVPTSLDGEPTQSLPLAFAINLGLLGVFAIQHSGMARPTFKEWWTQYVPKPIERSTYVLLSNVAMILLFVFWQPLGGTVWRITHPTGAAVMYSLYALGWVTVFYSTCLINHFELFGLRQVYLAFRKQPYRQLPFKEPGLYKYVRHPLYIGWLMVFWFTPTMTVSHLLFALGTTGYILIAIQLEERNLVDLLPGYADYRRRVPMLLPRMSKRTPTMEATADLCPVER